jgi:cytochrome c oxidase subunit 3
MSEEMTAAKSADRWGGGSVSPYGVSWQKMMMWLFIVGDALLFGGFLAAYGFNRIAGGVWPDQLAVFHGPMLITFMTFILITSSATMASAVLASRNGDMKAAAKFTWATLLGGAIFLGCQAYEWSMMLGPQGATLTKFTWDVPYEEDGTIKQNMVSGANIDSEDKYYDTWLNADGEEVDEGTEGATKIRRYDVPAFGGFFFMVTGFHGTHVLIGLIILLIVACRVSAGKTKAEGVELAGLYWHFVDLVWVFIFGCFYLI